MTPDWQTLVPEVALRPVQIRALDAIDAGFESGSRVVLLQAPTGVGKSLIELALCRLNEDRGSNSFVVTPQRILQDQLGVWERLKVMKGRAGYPCALMRGLSAATAPCTKESRIREQHVECSDAVCPYFKALAEAKASPTVVCNYAGILAQSRIAKHFDRRGLLCLDEGHTAAEWTRRFATISIHERHFHALSSQPVPEEDEDYVPWLRSTLSYLEEVPAGLPDELRSEVSKALSLSSALGLNGQDPTVPWAGTREGKVRHAVPLKVSPLSWMLTSLGSKILVVTATVLDSRLLAAELGLSKESTTFVDLPDAFHRSRRPIVRSYIGRISMRTEQELMPRLINRLEETADKHDGEPGIIHTISHRMADAIFEELSDRIGHRRTIVRVRKGPERDTIIADFLSGRTGPGAILIGPALMEGVDGAGDSCRWQAMCKVPWPNRGDPVVKHVMSTTGKWAEPWYAWKAAQQSVQGFGRVCRSDDDFGTTYLMDAGFERVLSSGYVPRYVKEAVT